MAKSITGEIVNLLRRIRRIRVWSALRNRNQPAEAPRRRFRARKLLRKAFPLLLARRSQKPVPYVDRYLASDPFTDAIILIERARRQHRSYAAQRPDARGFCARRLRRATRNGRSYRSRVKRNDVCLSLFLSISELISRNSFPMSPFFSLRAERTSS